MVDLRAHGGRHGSRVRGLFLCSLPHDVLVNILDRLPRPDQLAVAAADRRLASAVAETRIGPLRTVDYTPGNALSAVPPTFPWRLTKHAVDLLTLAGPHLRVLRLHGGMPSIHIQHILVLACEHCSEIRSLAFPDNGSIGVHFFDLFQCRLSRLTSIELAFSHLLTLGNMNVLPPSVTCLELYDPRPSLLHGGFADPSDRIEELKVTVYISEGHSTAHEFTGDFAILLLNIVQENLDVPSWFAHLSVKVGMVTVTVLDVLEICADDVDSAADTIAPLHAKMIAQLDGRMEGDETTVFKNLSLDALHGSQYLPDNSGCLTTVEHFDLDMDAAILLPFLGDPDIDDLLLRLRTEARALSKVTVRAALSPSGDPLGKRLFGFAASLLTSQDTVRRLHVSREMLGKTYVPELQQLLNACTRVTHLQLCDPELGDMLDNGRPECPFAELYDVPKFLAVLATSCPHLETLYVERGAKHEVAIPNTPREKFDEAYEAIRKYENERPFTNIETLRFQVDQWRDRFRLMEQPEVPVVSAIISESSEGVDDSGAHGKSTKGDTIYKRFVTFKRSIAHRLAKTLQNLCH